MPGEDQFASSPAPKPPQCLAAKTVSVGKNLVQDVCLRCESPVALRVCQTSRTVRASISSARQRHSTRSGVWLDQNPRPSTNSKTELQRILEDQNGEMTEKESILARIREALTVRATF